MLEVSHLNADYGQHPALQDVSLSVGKGEIVVILGANGAGKSTLLRAMAGICEGEVSGEITLSGKSLMGLSSDNIVESGVALVPEGRGIFGDLTVKENLLLGAYSARARSSESENLEQVLTLFPKLAERQSQIARTMSGGEQQMVAIGRAMMSAPDILMLDEPSLGLAPLLCKELFQNLKRVKQLQIGILLVEQNAKQSLAIADRGYLLENTRITHEDTADKLATDPAVQKAYLGAGVTTRAAGSAASATDSDDSVQTPSMPDSLSNTVSRDNAGTPAKSTGAASTLNHSVVSNRQIERITHDIEQAAQNARKRGSSRTQRHSSSQSRVRNRPNGSSSIHEKGPAEDNSPVPVIEVYKRPRVEVYRRRPGGEFERD